MMAATPQRMMAASPQRMMAASPQLIVPRLRGVSHGIAFLIALAAATVVIVLAPAGRATVAVAIYGAGLTALFGASALYHRWPGPARLRPVLQRVDHSTIFIFIAACDTPIALIVLHGLLVWVVLALAWTGAGAGVVLTLGTTRAPRSLLAGSYLALGWITVIAVPELLSELGPAPVILLAAGGLLYSAGAAVYAAQRPDPWPRTFGFHEIFHALVILAAAA
jgi:hemolysin III